MGHILESTPEMGEYNVEVRRESFYLSGSSNWAWVRTVKGREEIRDDSIRPRGKGWEARFVKRCHAIFVYANGDTGQGTAEILIEDIPKVRAALDEVERYLRKRSGSTT